MKKIAGLLIIGLFFIPTLLVGQKKVLGKPIHFDAPIDFFNEANAKENLRRFWNYTQRKSKEEAWMVISDRDNNKVYKKPSLGSSVKMSINFKEYFYVVEEKDDWVKIVEAIVDNLRIVRLKKKMGWVPKENLLLWNSGLVTRSSRIVIKAIQTNTLQDIENIHSQEDLEVLNLKCYSNPSGMDLVSEEKHLNIYFILKKDLDTGRYLLARTSYISRYNSQESIIGWIDERRIAFWSSRICLEPNFNESAFNERKSNPDKFRFRVFEDFLTARAFAEDHVQKGSIIWEDDPILVSSQKLSSSNPRRLNGGFFRFPLITVEKTTDKYEYYTVSLLKTKTLKVGNMRGMKIRFLTEGYVPKYIKGAKYPTSSYTLFMTEFELINYHRILARIYSFIDFSNRKREALFEIYKELITQFTMEEGLRGIKIEDFKRSQIVSLMQGLFYSGLSIDMDMDIRIGDILDEQKVSNEDIDALLDRFSEVIKSLEDITRQGDAYEFCYSTDSNNRYYWISLEDLF